MRDFCFLYGSASLGFGGRAVVQPMNEPIPAGFFRFNPDEPENEANLARSVFVQLKHPQTSLRPYGRDSGAHSAMFARPCGGICLSCFARIKNNKAFWPVVSRETFFLSFGRRTSRFASTLSF